MLHPLTLAAFGSGGVSYAQTFSATGIGGDIPDCFVGVFVVPLPSELVDLCDLELDVTGITHVILSDLDIYLIDPFGETLEIITDRGGTIPVSEITLTFSDRGSRLPSESGPLVSDPFLPEGKEKSDNTAIASVWKPTNQAYTLRMFRSSRLRPRTAMRANTISAPIMAPP